MNEFQYGEGGYQHGSQPSAPVMGRVAFEGYGGFGAEVKQVIPDAVHAVAYLLYNDQRFLGTSVSGLGLFDRIDNVCAAYGVSETDRQDVYAQASDIVYETSGPQGELYDTRYTDLWSEELGK